MKLNKILGLGVIGLAMATVTSCSDDYLNAVNHRTLDTETAAEIMEQDPSFIDSYVSGIWSWMVTYGTTSTSHDDYAMMSILHSTDMAAEDMTCFSFSWHGYDYGLENRNYDYRRVRVNWVTLYTMVNKANEIISFFEEEPEDITLKGALGNAYAVRAYANLYLIQLFQQPTVADASGALSIDRELPGVPLVVTTTEGYSQDDINNLSDRNTVGEVLDAIEADITKAIDLLDGYVRPNKNTINKAVAQGIAARYYLLNRQWDKAAEMAKAARADFPVMSGTAEANGIRDGFMDITNSEWMWGFDHSSETSTIYASYFSHISNLAPGYSGILYTGRGIDARLYSQLSDTDYRKMYWFNDAEGKSQSTAVASEEASAWQYPYAILKYGWDGAWTMDYLWMRGAEMVLIEAEALARQQKNAEAAVVLKELMAQRDPSWNKATVTVEDVYLQRRLELIGEGFAYFDLKRMRKGIDRNYEGNNHLAGYALTVGPDEVVWTYQIPQTEIQENIYITDEDQNP
ncbi:MAG: RagB/SusD family nutrient uptake outer membrane protein [Bacteroidaceae bacterium]|nr:RagB/SusD family nutrient uptake outer membrane protein [Bacteroidaceae bacterium]